ncbi:CubicO group peptidase (beta-lactamase class C family) [Pseudaminobacter salicylatoxidans]|uniref:CubicO group peptidase (Beta-lactamase class C family) n=1 Tax=Pseudaminobacter salicylatoxidans TaxID=93369 RepID=A0A316C2K0_PSESE|nr:serine hydrolase [Pseudaminobacter salicylatoxidans]PWJ83920.1 CubicO group peptidase (beta-lactamase class C family) [Pseudaminobacter salicylatoxidans]
MRTLLKAVKWVAGLVVVALVILCLWLYAAPPALIRVAAGYTAKIVCSNVFVAGRDAQDVLATDVQAPGHPVLRLMSAEVDSEKATVSAGLFGLFGGGLAVARDNGGCATVPDGNVAAAKAFSQEPPAEGIDPHSLWPRGERVEPSQNQIVNTILDDAGGTGPGMRAVVVIKDGRIVGERYGDGFSPSTPLLGWSMTKTVNAAIIGTLMKAHKTSLEATALFDAWKDDDRAKISLADLMAMSSGLEFNEDYGAVADVTRMLYLEPDMAGFAQAKPLAGEIGKVWSYSSGTAVMLSRLWQNAVGNRAVALAWPRTALFDPLGMTSAVMETDARGTFVGSSYLYATAHDWARFAQFLIDDGMWNGVPLLPEGFVSWMREPAPASHGRYGRGQLWLVGPKEEVPGREEGGFDLPSDTFWMLGHDGQSIAIVPSQKLAVIRLGLTPDSLGYRPQAMVAALVKALETEIDR